MRISGAEPRHGVSRVLAERLLEIRIRALEIAGQAIGIAAVVEERRGQAADARGLGVGPVREIEAPELIIGGGRLGG